MPSSLQTYMANCKCKDALMLDGGGSASCNFKGQTITTSRKVNNYILVYLKKTTSTATTSSYAVPTITLRKGSRGNGVKWLQTILNKKGFNCGAVDGIFGNGTFNAVIKYQKYNNLVADGIVGKNTRAKLLG